MPDDPYPYASAEDRARHRRSIAARWERAQKDAEAITALFRRNDAERNPAFAKDWAERQASFQAFVPNMDPAVNVPLVDLVRRNAA